MSVSNSSRTTINKHDLSSNVEAQCQLVHASAHSHPNVVQRLLAGHGPRDVNGPDQAGHTALPQAAYYGRTSVVRMLLAVGAHADQYSKSGMTPLMMAASRGNLEMVQLLLASGASTILTSKQPAPVGNTAGMWAAKSGHEDVVRVLNGAALEQAALGAAASMQHTSLLLPPPPPPPRTPQPSHQGRQNIASTAGSGAAMFPVKAGTALEETHSHHLSAPHLYGSGPRVSGGTLGSWGSVVAAPHVIAEDTSEVGMGGQVTYLDEGAYQDQRLLVLACKHGRLDAVERLLLAGGVNVNDIDQEGGTPVMHAACGGHVSVVDLLIRRGAQCDSTDKVGHSPLLHAAVRGHAGVVHLLLARGADADRYWQGGTTALMMAARQDDAELVQLLLAGGASTTLTTQHPSEVGHTARMLAAAAGHAEVVMLLDAAASRHLPGAPLLAPRSPPGVSSALPLLPPLAMPTVTNGACATVLPQPLSTTAAPTASSQGRQAVTDQSGSPVMLNTNAQAAEVDRLGHRRSAPCSSAFAFQESVGTADGCVGAPHVYACGTVGGVGVPAATPPTQPSVAAATALPAAPCGCPAVAVPRRSAEARAVSAAAPSPAVTAAAAVLAAVSAATSEAALDATFVRGQPVRPDTAVAPRPESTPHVCALVAGPGSHSGGVGTAPGTAGGADTQPSSSTCSRGTIATGGSGTSDGTSSGGMASNSAGSNSSVTIGSRSIPPVQDTCSGEPCLRGSLPGGSFEVAPPSSDPPTALQTAAHAPLTAAAGSAVAPGAAQQQADNGVDADSADTGDDLAALLTLCGQPAATAPASSHGVGGRAQVPLPPVSSLAGASSPAAPAPSQPATNALHVAVASLAPAALADALAEGATVGGTPPPEHLCCPITQCLMVDPVGAWDGYTYSRAAIESWFHISSLSPISGQQLSNKRLVPDLCMRGLVLAWSEGHAAGAAVM